MTSDILKSSGTVDQVGKLSRPDSGSIVARSSDSDWEGDGANGFWYKHLFEDSESGQKTMLMKVDARAVASPHDHGVLEQVYVLEGDFYDADRTYGPGDFVVRAPDAVHTGGTRTGALVLLVYSR